MGYLEAFLLTVVVVLLLHIWLRHPRCANCGAKAMPNQTASMMKAWNKADEYAGLLRSTLPLLDGDHDGSQQYEDMRAYQADQIRDALAE